MNTNKTLVINTSWCKGCGICVAFCPKKALMLEKGCAALKEGAQCVLCGKCEQLCPDYAIYIEENETGGFVQWGIEQF